MSHVGDGDLAAILANGDFNDDAVFTITPANPPAPAVTLTAKGWFTAKTEAVNLAGEFEANDANFFCETSAVATVNNGMSVVINGTTYEVKRKQNLGIDGSLIYLKTS